MNTFPYDDGFSFTDEESAEAFDHWESTNPDRAVFLEFLWRGIERYSHVWDSQDHRFINIDAIIEALGCDAHWEALFSLFSIPDEYQTDEKARARENEFVWNNDFIDNMLQMAVSGAFPKRIALGRLILIMQDCFNRAEVFEWARECQRKKGGAAFTAGISLHCNPNSRIENEPLWEAWNDGWRHSSQRI